MRYGLALAQLCALAVVLRAGIALRLPLFTASLAVGTVATAIYRSTDVGWLANWWGVGASALLFRAAATCEACLLLAGRSRGRRAFQWGIMLVAMAFSLRVWMGIAYYEFPLQFGAYRVDPARTYFYFRDAAQIGLCYALLAALLIGWALPTKFPCPPLERRHGLLLLVVLASYAVWSLLRTAGVLHLNERDFRVLMDWPAYGLESAAYLTWAWGIRRIEGR